MRLKQFVSQNLTQLFELYKPVPWQPNNHIFTYSHYNLSCHHNPSCNSTQAAKQNNDGNNRVIYVHSGEHSSSSREQEKQGTVL